MVDFLLLYHRNPCRKVSSLCNSGASLVLLHVKAKQNWSQAGALIAVILTKVALTHCTILYFKLY